MSTKSVVSVIVAAALLSVAGLSSAFAESIPAEEIQQFSGAAAPDVDAGASKGADKSIVVQEKQQFSNSTGPNVPERAEKGGLTLPQMEQEALP
ncbi:MAG: hypothetical protein WDN31_18520 [Hyphomicrobium sp.]